MTKRHTTLKWRRINVDATWSRRIDVDTTSFWCCVPAGKGLNGDLKQEHKKRTTMGPITDIAGANHLNRLRMEPLFSLNELPYTIYWKILISILGMSGYVI